MRPALLGMHDDAGLARCLDQCQCRPQNPPLTNSIACRTHRLTERKLDCQGARAANLLRPIRHRRYHNGDQSLGLQETRQPGHVDGAVRSGRHEQDDVHRLAPALRDDARHALIRPAADIGRITLVAHERIAAGRQRAQLAADNHRPGGISR